MRHRHLSYETHLVPHLLVCAALAMGACTHPTEREGAPEPASASDDATHEPATPTVDEPKVRSVDLCGDPISDNDLSDLLEGTLFVAAVQHEHGLSASSAAIGFALELALNGIDFGALGTGSVEFSDGVYVFQNGDAKIGLAFVFTEDVGPWAKGTRITHQLLEADSFVTDVDVSLDVDFSWTDPSVDGEVTFEPGPLFDLVDEVTFDGVVPSVSLRTDLVGVEIVTEQTYSFAAPRDRDELTVHLDTEVVPLSEIEAVLELEGLGLVMTDTAYSSPYFDLEQVVTDATFMLGRLDGARQNRFALAGDYTAVAAKGSRVLYQHGVIHTTQGNYVDFFCDEQETVHIGRAVHDASLTSGRFTHVGGATFDYSLSNVPSIADRTRE